MIKDGVCSDFDLLDTALDRVLILLVSLGLLAPNPIGAEKVEHTPNKLFLRIIRIDMDRNTMLAEVVLKNLGNIEAGIGSYRIDVGE